MPSLVRPSRSCLVGLRLPGQPTLGAQESTKFGTFQVGPTIPSSYPASIKMGKSLILWCILVDLIVIFSTSIAAPANLFQKILKQPSLLLIITDVVEAGNPVPIFRM